MRTILEYVKKQKSAAVTNMAAKKTDYPELVTLSELSHNSFEEVILSRFAPYYNSSYLEICGRLGITPSKSKSRIAILANIIATGGNSGLDTSETEEFRKSGIRLKTITSFSNGRVKEDTSFENIDYEEVYNEVEWVDSRLYELFTSRFLFVLFQQPEGESQKDFDLDNLQLKQVFFWTMPPHDLETAESYWENIREHILNNEISPDFFWTKAMHRKFHVRPKGRNSSDLAVNPNGGLAKKYCYWFNSEYVTGIIKEH